MKRLNIIIIIFLFALMVQSVQTDVLAMETGFSTEELSEEEKITFLSNVNITLLNTEPQKRGIDCFNVNEKGLIAIGTSDSEKKYICIYNSEGVFQYGYAFHSSGSFGVEWDEDKIIIYWVRSDVAVSVDSVGEIIAVSKIQNTTDNNYYWRHSVFARERSIENNRYIMKNGDGILDIFNPSYSQIIQIDENDETRIIYDVSTSYSFEVLIILIGVIIFVGIAIYVMIREFRKLNPKNISKPS